MAEAFATAGMISSPQHSLQGGESLRMPHRRNAASSVVFRTRRRIPVGGIVAARVLKPVVERFKIHHEKSISDERMKELGVSRWSKWSCGPNVTMRWHWEAEELVYISKGSLEITPDGCEDSAFFYAGDFVRFPKWFEADMTFDGNYEQCYKFVAYGD